MENPVEAAETNKKQPEKIELHIALTPQGVAVARVVKNEMLALFLCEKAKDIIKQINQPKIITPKNRVFGAFGGKK